MGSWLILVCLPLVAPQVVPFFRPDNVTRVTGQVQCGSTPAAFLTVEWWEDRGQQIDVLLGSTRTDGRGFFQVGTNRPAPAKSYLFIKNNCGSQREQSSRFEVNLLSPFNMQIQLQSNNNGNGPNQVSGTVFCGSRVAPNTIIEWWADRGSRVDALLGVTQSDARGAFNVFRTNTNDARTYLIARSSCGGNGQMVRFPVNPMQPFNMQLQLQTNTSPQNPTRVSGTVRCGNQAAVWTPVEWWADRGRQIDVLLASSQTDGRGFFSLTRSLTSDRDTYLVIKHSCGSNRQRTSTFRVNSGDATNMQIQLRDGRDRSSDSRDSRDRSREHNRNRSRERGLRALEDEDDEDLAISSTTAILVEPTEIVGIPVVV